jgi:hypothetical protein
VGRNGERSFGETVSHRARVRAEEQGMAKRPSRAVESVAKGRAGAAGQRRELGV